ncbi:macro domain-containing protein [Flavobacterium jejuense]|uniref:Macro domain-containing protein n=1 Tax=Flavobacterium jejuense TaxID=1544455 RepID=A0ABX0IU29_9FLAO|nr:macro domain-containing protein [Flavobacterium jejuense]NHN27302.1 macro domain-containing protein [Flavobacterium jejuense]
MEKIEYIKGDATYPIGIGNKLIVHICNDIGAWGKGFVLAISKRWKNPELLYKEWFKAGVNFELGEVQFVKIESDLFIANMIGQHKIRKSKTEIPIRYKAVRNCLKKVADFAEGNDFSVHMPRIGCGLAGGKWNEIEPIIKEELINRNIKVTVYDFE